MEFQSVIQLLPGNPKFTDPYFPGCLYFCVHNFILNDLIFFMFYVNYTMQQGICQGILYNCVLFFLLYIINTLWLHCSLPEKDKLHFYHEKQRIFSTVFDKTQFEVYFKNNAVPETKGEK